MIEPPATPGPPSEEPGQKSRTVADASRYCPNCSAEMVERACKLKCLQCGFYLSCSDFY